MRPIVVASYAAVLLAGPWAARMADARPSRERVAVDSTRASLSMPAHARRASAAAPAEPPSRLIYLNRCVGGCTIYSGREDSRRNVSSVASRTSQVPEFAHGDKTWDETVACAKETYGRFNITVTDVDPCAGATTCSTPHWEVIVAGAAGDIGYRSNGGAVGGVSPFDFSDCSIIENSITYAFADTLGDDVNELCWTIAQETAHSFGLDHEFLGADPMTYLPTPAKKRFQDVLADCGESSARDCECRRDKQNSVQELFAIFGAATATPPDVMITTPLAGSAVEPGFVLRAAVTDDQGVAEVEFLVDNQVVQALTVEPYVSNGPADLASGSHRVEVRAIDANGTPGSHVIDVYVGEPCERPGDCELVGENYTCVGGRCVPGPGSPGGLGEACGGPSECDSGFCVSSAGTAVCAEPCSPGAANQCPDGFACADATGGGGFCIVSESGGCAGCSSQSNDAPLGAIAAGGLVAGFIVRRRRNSSTPRR